MQRTDIECIEVRLSVTLTRRGEQMKGLLL